jgi:hypothetical protein
LVVTDVQFAYDTSKLVRMERRRHRIHVGKVTSEKIFERTSQRPLMHPYHCGGFFEICCCCCQRYIRDNNRHQTDSIDYYTKKENEVKAKMNELRDKTLKRPLNIVFVTFQNQKMTDTFLKDYRLGLFGSVVYSLCATRDSCTSCYLCRDHPKNSGLSDTLQTSKWHVKYAPAPSNIKWENISKIGANWWIRVVLINIVLIILMVFFTTPAILLDKLTPWGSFFSIDVASLEVI